MMETEIESRDDRKSKDLVFIFGILTIVFAIATATLFVEMQNVRGLNADLRNESSDLEYQLGSLNITYLGYVASHSHNDSEYYSCVADLQQLNSEYDELSSEYEDYVADHEYTNWQYENYVDTHEYTSTEYWNYVNSHLYSNAEYEEVMFDFYYFKPENQKLGVYDLDDELLGLLWSEPYQAGVFDCGEMSACLEWYLENRGWNVVIVVGDAPFGGSYHAWLLVETSAGAYMPVEATSLEVVWWADPDFDNYFVYDYDFENIHEAMDYYETEVDWWTVGFSPLET